MLFFQDDIHPPLTAAYASSVRQLPASTPSACGVISYYSSWSIVHLYVLVVNALDAGAEMISCVLYMFYITKFDDASDVMI